jgi:RNA polymerase subunit RPABC4/transcription elongation factor Spt4
MPNNRGFVEKLKDNWEQRTNEKRTFKAELRIVPQWLIGVLCLLYLIALGVFFWVVVSMPNVRPFGISVEPLSLELLSVFGAVTGVAIPVSALVMLLGYIGRDARRRGMTPVVWVPVALLVPYLIGILLYFVVREPLPYDCPNCGRRVSTRFNFCPHCKFNLRPACPNCKAKVAESDRYCPNCASELPTTKADPGAQTVAEYAMTRGERPLA